MMFRFKVFVVALFVLGGMSMAQDYNCKNPQYQQEMNYCAYQDFLTADRQLNGIYPLAIAATRQMDSYYQADQQGAEQALREAQRAWITYRDKACEAEGFVFHGGSMEPLMVSTCKSRLTRERVEGLRLLSTMN